MLLIRKIVPHEFNIHFFWDFPEHGTFFFDPQPLSLEILSHTTDRGIVEHKS